MTPWSIESAQLSSKPDWQIPFADGKADRGGGAGGRDREVPPHPPAGAGPQPHRRQDPAGELHLVPYFYPPPLSPLL